MSLGYVLLEEGAEVDLRADMREVLSILDNEVPKFSCGNYSYQICSLSGVLGASWRILVNLIDTSRTTTTFPPRIGLIELNCLKGGSVSLKIVPRDPWREEQALAFGEEGRFFANFVFQMVNALKARGYIGLPGAIPAL